MCVGSELRTLLLQTFQFSSFTQLCLTLGLQHARFPCPSPTPGWNYSNLCPSSWWCHPVISSSVDPFSSCLQSFPASGFFSNESVLCIRWPTYCSFSFSISSSNEYSGLISFRISKFRLYHIFNISSSLHVKRKIVLEYFSNL